MWRVLRVCGETFHFLVPRPMQYQHTCMADWFGLLEALVTTGYDSGCLSYVQSGDDQVVPFSFVIIQFNNVSNIWSVFVG